IDPANRTASKTPLNHTFDPVLLQRRIRPVTPRPVASKRVAATAITKAEGAQGLDQVAVAVRVPRAFGARDRGTVIHAFLERWDFKRDPAESIALALRGAAVSEEIGLTLTADCLRVAGKIREHALGRKLADAKSLEREVPFLLQTDGVLISGAIDAVIDNAVLLDFKTGTPTETDRAQHRLQLQLYAAALESLTGHRAQEAYVVYVDGDGEFTEGVDVAEPQPRLALERASAVIKSMNTIGQST
ncbi:MAG: PD-(D/E)XK nuclease family protein, partial [Candidatus Hydrogenedentes bacterium]|nr:PD-(D/E)XK nuclease family protein [Candidatus Hydrogenedentota bacterium]